MKEEKDFVQQQKQRITHLVENKKWYLDNELDFDKILAGEELILKQLQDNTLIPPDISQAK